MDSIRRTVVIGNESTLIKPIPKHSNGMEPTHKWRVFVHGPDNEDISPWVSQVKFELHETFIHPTRIRNTKPFEVAESGWGEFDIQVIIFVRGHEHQPVRLAHQLRIHSTKSKKGKPEYPFFNVAYHDFELTDCSPQTRELLTQHYPQSVQRPLLRGQEPEEIEVYQQVEDYALNDAHNDVKLKLQQALALYQNTQQEIEKKKQAILALEEQQHYPFGKSQFVKVSEKDLK